jgi:hypothetical protein
MTSSWEEKGKSVCGNILEEADAALKSAKVKEADEARVRIMEASRDKLVALVDTVHDETEEKDQDQLNDLGEEVEYNKSHMTSIAQMVKGTVDKGLSKRAQRAFDEFMEVARIGQQMLEVIQMRLDFYSRESEAGSYLGGATRGGREGARGATLEQPPALDARGGQPGGGSFHFRSGQDGEAWVEAR